MNIRSLCWTVGVIGLAGPVSAGVSVKGDFNNDGYADLAIGVPLENVGPSADAGAVNVIYGSANGLTSAGAQFFDALSITGSAAANDAFGTALASGDFNNDGNADLAIGIPFRKVSGKAGAGAVVILYGSAGGLTTAGYALITQNSTNVQGTAGVGDQFGAALTAGDFNIDSNDDLAIGVPGETINGHPGAGAVAMILGSGAGLVPNGNKLFSQNTAQIADAAETGDFFGLVLASGDFDGDACVDVAVGVPGEDINSATDAGMVHVIYGSAAALTGFDSQKFRQQAGGILGTADKGDRFGSALVAGDFDGDTYPELVIGVPTESFNGKSKAGLLHVIQGSPTGLITSGSFVINQAPGFGDNLQAKDLFSASLAAGDTNNDGRDELLIGVPGEGFTNAAGAGAFHCMFGSAGGLTNLGNQFWHAATLGLGAAQPGSLVASSLTVGDFDGDTYADVAAGNPGMIVNAKAGAGNVLVLYGSAAGLTAGSLETWDQNTANIPDSAEASDRFGASLGR